MSLTLGFPQLSILLILGLKKFLIANIPNNIAPLSLNPSLHSKPDLSQGSLCCGLFAGQPYKWHNTAMYTRPIFSYSTQSKIFFFFFLNMKLQSLNLPSLSGCCPISILGVNRCQLFVCILLGTIIMRSPTISRFFFSLASSSLLCIKMQTSKQLTWMSFDLFIYF